MLHDYADWEYAFIIAAVTFLLVLGALDITYAIAG